MFKRFGVLVAIVSFAMSACPANAITVPINENAGAPAVTTLQQTVAEVANGTAHIVTSIEAAVDRIVGAITDRLASVNPPHKTLSNTAAAAAPVESNPATASTADEPITSTFPDPAPLPPAATTTQIIVEKEQPVIEAVPTDDTVTQEELADLLSGLRSALSVIAAQRNATPTNVESQIAALQSVISSQGYSAVASPPLGGGAPNTIAAAGAIDQLFGTAITNPSITSGSITGASLSGGSVSADSLSVSGDTSLSGDLSVGGNFSAGSISFGAASSSNSITTNASSTNLFSTLANFTTAIVSTLNASVANIVGFTATNATTTNLAVLGTSYFAGNVGIGTTSPSRLLTLDSSSATGTILRISNSSTGGHVFDLLSTGSSNTNGAGRLDIFDSTAGQARLSIAANGNVGIGTTSPFAAFAVVGNAFLSGNLSVGDATTTRSNLGLPYASSAYIATLSSPIAAWGDSLTQGTFTTVNTPYPTQLSQISGYVVFNGGVGAQTSAQIATRMLLAGDKYTWPTIIWAGRNDISGTLSTDEPIIDANIALMVSALQSVGNNNYIVMSILNGEGEGTGTNNYNEIIQINSDLATIYGSHYVDVRSYLVQNGLGVAGITPSAQDLTDISNDVPPTDLRYDWLHPNTAGYGVVAQDVYANMNLLNSLFNTQSVVTVNDLRQSLGDFSSGLYIGGIRALYANSANSVTLVGVGAGFSLSTTTLFNTAVGYQSLYYATSSSYNTAVGPYSLYGDTTGSQNTAIGYTALYGDTTGGSNVAIGHNAMHSNTTGGSSVAAGWGALQGNSTGNSDIALGYSAMYANLTGSNNVAIGQSALYNNKSATSTIAIGYGTAQGGAVYNNQGGVYVGFEAGFSAASSSNYNTFLGYQAGFDISTGTNNIILGPEASTGGNHLTTGTNNIGIGYNLVFPGGTAAKNQLNIGNFIFGTGLTTAQSGTSIPATLTGSLAFGTSTPYSTLEVWGPNAASTSAFAVVNSASTTEFTVYDTGNATLAGSLVQNSDQRLKTNIQDLDGSSSLAEIEALNPVTFNWIDPAKSSLPQLGFIAQQAQSVFPNLVSTTSPTALTPDGTLSLNYIDLISPIVAAIQELDKEITSLASTVAGFAQSITTTLLSAQEADVQKLCVGSTCVTPAQFQAMVAAANQSASASASPASLILVATDTPPVIAINGDNPAIVQVGASYSDLGATITGPQADLNLGIKTFLNGLFVRNIQLDTSAAATDTIDYVVTDQNGLTSSSTRTIIVLPAADPSTTAPPASSAATSSTSATPSTPT